MRPIAFLILLVLISLVALNVEAQTSKTTPPAPPAPTAAATVIPANFVPQPGQVVVSGTVPDVRTKTEVLRKLQGMYGIGQVIDQIEVRSDVTAPNNWSQHVVDSMITSQLKNVHRGYLEVDGTHVRISGDVESEPMRQNIVNQLAGSLDQNYRITSALRVPVIVPLNGIIEFEVNSSVLTPAGQRELDEVAGRLLKISSNTIQVFGHTDGTGNRATNIALSQARAEAVKNYLVDKGLAPSRIDAIGVGPDQPIASNDTAEGRARNRRIEFRASN